VGFLCFVREISLWDCIRFDTFSAICPEDRHEEKTRKVINCVLPVRVALSHIVIRIRQQERSKEGSESEEEEKDRRCVFDRKKERQRKGQNVKGT
jgi:hypothetical protein